MLFIYFNIIMGDEGTKTFFERCAVLSDGKYATDVLTEIDLITEFADGETSIEDATTFERNINDRQDEHNELLAWIAKDEVKISDVSTDTSVGNVPVATLFSKIEEIKTTGEGADIMKDMLKGMPVFRKDDILKELILIDDIFNVNEKIGEAHAAAAPDPTRKRLTDVKYDHSELHKERVEQVFKYDIKKNKGLGAARMAWLSYKGLFSGEGIRFDEYVNQNAMLFVKTDPENVYENLETAANSKKDGYEPFFVEVKQ